MLLLLTVSLAVWCLGIVSVLHLAGEPFAWEWLLIGVAVAPWVVTNARFNRKSCCGPLARRPNPDDSN
jgi:hypothetical protein